MNRRFLLLTNHHLPFTVLLLLLFVAVTARAALNISSVERQILQKAGINTGDYPEWRFDVKDGHLKAVYLNNSGLTKLPLALLELPYVEVVDLYDNNISGNIGQLAEAYAGTNPAISQNLRILNIDGNQLTGDIGPLVELLDPVPTINNLYARNNRISEISVLPTNAEFWVGLSDQQLDLQIDFNADMQTPADLMTLLPSAVHYNPWDHVYQDYHTVYLYKDDRNVMDIYESGDKFNVWTAGDLRFQNGDVFDARCNDISFRVRVLFTKGDVNFSGTIDDDDVQDTGDCIYHNEDPWTFNYTAADLNNDGIVNSLDLVLLQHKVEGTTPQTTTQQGDNTIAIGDLLFNSEEKNMPVSIGNANDIVAMQFDVLVPFGVWVYIWDNITERVAADRRFEHSHIGDENGCHIYRFLFYTESGGSLLSGHSGDVMTMTLIRNDDLKVKTFKWQVRNVIFATTDSRNVYTGATLGTIDFNMAADDEEWDILVEANPMRQSDNGTQPLWDFSGGPDTAKDLEGITIEDGHITKINLSSRKLTGAFPFALTKLPYLEELIVYSNALSGDIGEQAEAFRKTNPIVSANLKKISIDHCEFTGNIGPMVSLFPNIETLDAGDNHITGISPLPNHQLYLYLDGQRLDNLTVDVNLAMLNVETFHKQLPDVLRYNYSRNSLNNDIHIYCYREPRENVFDLQTYDNGIWEGWSSGLFLQNGEVFKAESSNGKYQLRLTFPMGDANFDGRIDVADVQRLAYCLGRDSYRGWGDGCNMTASDLNADGTLNVLDVVLLVNKVLSQQPTAVPAYVEQPAAWICCDDGQLTVNATQPVAALDIMVSGSNAITLSGELERLGMTCSVEQRNGRVHLVAWSLTGDMLPAGQTILGRLDGSAARVAGAVLVDSEARRMPIATGQTTDISNLQDSGEKNVYELRMGHRRSIRIDADGHKALYMNK